MSKRCLGIALSLVLTGGCAANATDVAEDPPGSVGLDMQACWSSQIQLLTVSDWHAQLDPIGTGATAVGGAAVLSSYFKAERATNPNTLTLTAGDAFGASPPLSAFFGEEPAVKAMNLMKFDADTFGNHNFDSGVAQLQKLVDLGTFKHISSNLDGVKSNLTGVTTPYHIFKVGTVRVGVIGVTNPDAPSLLFPGRMGTISVQEPVAAANKAILQARMHGAHVIVVLVHMGATAVDAAGTPTGPLMDFSRGLKWADVVVGDHTDFAVNTKIDRLLVVENKSKGATYARISLDVLGPFVLSSSATFVTPLVTGVTPDPEIETMLAPYRAKLGEVQDAPIGVATATFPRGSNIERLQEVAIGDLIADAIRERYGTQLAFVNGGGIRAPLPSAYVPADKLLRRPTAGYAAGPPYDLVLGDIYTTLPFGNACATRTVTGSQLWAVLEHSISSLPAANGKFLQISGFKFTYSASAAPGARVTSVSLEDGTPIAKDATVYTAVTSDFTNVGGDGYTMLADGTGVTRDIMADVLADYVKAKGTITPTIAGRIVATP